MTSDLHRRRPLWRRPWILPLGLVTLTFLIMRLPTYLTLDPSQSLSQIRPDLGWHYPVLVTHIFLGAVALIAATLQVWPWLRLHHPQVHRWSGRTYVAVSLPAAIGAAAVGVVSMQGANQQVGTVLSAVLWFGTTLAGYRAARRKDFKRHREWMIRSFALVFSIVVNRLWLVLCFAVFQPAALTGGPIDPDGLAQAVGVSVWLSWVVNLLIAEWWLHRRPRRPRTRRARAVDGVGDGSAIVPAGQPAGLRL